MPSKIRSYKTIQSMYENYRVIDLAEKLVLEGHEYRLVGERRKGDSWVHVYRCEQERHNVIVYLRYNLPYLIKPVYSINGIALGSI